MVTTGHATGLEKTLLIRPPLHKDHKSRAAPEVGPVNPVPGGAKKTTYICRLIEDGNKMGRLACKRAGKQDREARVEAVY